MSGATTRFTTAFKSLKVNEDQNYERKLKVTIFYFSVSDSSSYPITISKEVLSEEQNWLSEIL